MSYDFVTTVPEMGWLWLVIVRVVLKGAATLEGPWEEVPAGGGAFGESALPMRFFKVEVVFP